MDFDPYKILEVNRSSSDEVIAAAYRALSKKYHPDLNKTLDAKTKMQKINEAYGKIRDAASRAQTNTELNRKNEDKAKPAEPKNTNNNQNQPPPAQPKNANSNNQNQPPAQPSSNYSAPSGDYNPRPWNYSPPPPGYYYSYPPWNYPPPPPSFYYPYPSSPSNNYYAQTGIYNPTSWSYPPPAQGHYSSNPPPIQFPMKLRTLQEVVC